MGRYAPSPTGSLHLGNLRTALAAYLSARAGGGRFLLRIEDIDRARSREEWVPRHLADLQALGIVWDEPPIRQSERTPLYAEALRQLQDAGAVFRCYCSRRELRDVASAPHGAEPTYPGTCRDLDDAECQRREAAGRMPAWRLRVPEHPTPWRDAFGGVAETSLSTAGGDFVLRRADGEWAYQLACAVDDALTGVTEVIRGEDLRESAARQAFLCTQLGHTAPAYGHVGLVVGEDGQRLAKRQGSADLAACRDAGVDPGGVLGYLGWSLGLAELGERPSMASLVERWARHTGAPESAVFRLADLRRFG